MIAIDQPRSNNKTLPGPAQRALASGELGARLLRLAQAAAAIHAAQAARIPGAAASESRAGDRR